MALALILRSRSDGLWPWCGVFRASCSGPWLGPEPRPAEELAPCGLLSGLWLFVFLFPNSY